MDSDWAYLPKHLIDGVLDKIEYVTDGLSTGLVCSSWHSLASTHRKKLMGTRGDRVPMLLVPMDIQNDDELWGIYSVPKNDFLKQKLLLPPYERPFSGSSDGWLVTLDDKLAVTFYKPFAENLERAAIRLPPLFADPNEEIVKHNVMYSDTYLYKFAASSHYNNSDLVFTVIWGDCFKLAYIRPAKDGAAWTCVGGPHHGPYEDVMFHKDRFYALSMWGKLVNFEVGSDEANLVTDEFLRYDDHCFKRYLVESCRGELLQVLRYQGPCESKQRVTSKFRLFKLLNNNEGYYWDEIKRLDDDCVVFLGDNTSVCGLTSEFIGYEKNCIYFTHDNDTTDRGEDGPWDLGFYNMETGTVKRGFTIEPKTIARMTRRIPIWVIPTFTTSS